MAIRKFLLRVVGWYSLASVSMALAVLFIEKCVSGTSAGATLSALLDSSFFSPVINIRNALSAGIGWKVIVTAGFLAMALMRVYRAWCRRRAAGMAD